MTIGVWNANKTWGFQVFPVPQVNINEGGRYFSLWLSPFERTCPFAIGLGIKNTSVFAGFSRARKLFGYAVAHGKIWWERNWR